MVCPGVLCSPKKGNHLQLWACACLIRIPSHAHKWTHTWNSPLGKLSSTTSTCYRAVFIFMGFLCATNECLILKDTWKIQRILWVRICDTIIFNSPNSWYFYFQENEAVKILQSKYSIRKKYRSPRFLIFILVHIDSISFISDWTTPITSYIKKPSLQFFLHFKSREQE